MSVSPKKGRRRNLPVQARLSWALAPPTMDDLILVLGAWRLWILGGLASALVGAALYSVAPPPYRSRATVNVDFHLERAWPQNTDREQFYYLERETRKLVEIAFSDRTLEAVTHDVPGATLHQLREGAALLSQPGNGGWHFFGTDPDPARASTIASAWARSFSAEVKREVMKGGVGGLEQYITADLTQSSPPRAERSIGVGTYMLAAALGLLTIAALGLLLLHPRR